MDDLDDQQRNGPDSQELSKWRASSGRSTSASVRVRLHRDHRLFLGRLNPIGVFLAGLIFAVTYVGGQVAQTVVHVPEATAGIFQATMLFFILASDILVRYRVRIIRDAPRAAPAQAVA